MKISNIASANVIRTGIAAAWNYSGRVVGLGWTAALIGSLGFGAYGQYSIASAGAAIINATADNPFFVRSFRIDEERYKRELCTRTAYATVAMCVGIAVFSVNYVVGMAIMNAAGEQLFNALKSKDLRAGRPDKINRWDTIRQISSITLAVAFLYLAPMFGHHPTLKTTTAIYMLPYLVILVACLRFIPGHRPAMPGWPKEMLLLSSEACAGAIYAQGAVIVIGWVSGAQIAGYYSVAQVSALAIAMIGTNYASTFVEKLRASGGHVSNAPPASHVVRLGALTGGAMVAIGAAILVWGGHDYIGWLCILMAGFTALRSINSMLAVVLFLQKKDWLRVRTTVGVALLQVALLFPLVKYLGGYGAAIGCIICDTIMFVVYYREIYHASAAAQDDSDAHPAAVIDAPTPDIVAADELVDTAAIDTTATTDTSAATDTAGRHAVRRPPAADTWVTRRRDPAPGRHDSGQSAPAADDGPTPTARSREHSHTTPGIPTTPGIQTTPGIHTTPRSQTTPRTQMTQGGVMRR